jgi:hypothetical protein
LRITTRHWELNFKIKAIMKNFIKMFLAACEVTFFAFSVNAQSVGINATGDTQNGSAMLEVSSTSKGLLLPRMTSEQMIAIASPSAGLMVWCTNCGTNGELHVYNGTAWTVICTSTASGFPGAPTIGTAVAGDTQASVPFKAPTSNGGSTITSYTATSNPGNIIGTLSQAGSGTITVKGLTNGTAYTFTVTATNAYGVGAPSAASNSVTPVAPLAIGQSYGGGIIAYILQSGDPGYTPGETHGLIAATANQGIAIAWAIDAYCGTAVPGGTGTAIGTGLANTNNIVAQNGAGTTYAAGMARAYTGGGYSDWYLPSKDELAKLYAMKVLGFGGFARNSFWSSFESTADFAWGQYFGNGNQGTSFKYGPNYVRAVRAF